MKLRPQTTHHVGDCVIGMLLIAGPWIFGFDDNRPALLVTLVIGAVIIANTMHLFSQVSSRRRVTLAAHMLADGAAGGLLIGAPWIFGFADRTWIPHLVIGCVVAGRAALFLLGLLVLEEVPAALVRRRHRS